MKKAIICMLFLGMVTLSKTQDLQPSPGEALLEVKVTDQNSIPEEGAVVYVVSEDNSISKNAKSNEDGMAKILLPQGKKYRFKVQKYGVEFNFDNLNELPTMDEPYTAEQPLSIQLDIKYVRSYTLDHMYFDVNRWDIKPDSYATLNKLIESMKKNPRLKIEIAGHTDNSGDAQANFHLSQKRADAIRDYLIQKGGIKADRVYAKGYGEHEPIAENTTAENKAKNRRTEVKIMQE